MSINLLVKAIKHKLGVCNKSLKGYNCHGKNNYKECK